MKSRKDLDRKQEIMQEIESFRNAFPTWQRINAKKDDTISSFLQKEALTLNYLTKEKLLKEIDELKMENSMLREKLSALDELSTKLSVKEMELDTSKQQCVALSLKVHDATESEKALESQVSDLKQKIDILQARLSRGEYYGLEIAHSKKVDNAERQSMISQQQTLMIEIERLQTYHSKYQDLIKNIEAAISTGRVCLVSGRGLVVTSMTDLANELAAEKKKL